MDNEDIIKVTKLLEPFLKVEMPIQEEIDKFATISSLKTLFGVPYKQTMTKLDVIKEYVKYELKEKGYELEE